MNRSYALIVQEVETRRAKLQAELCRAAEPLSAAGYLVATEVCFGEPARTIIDLVKSNSIDLIAMTTHGRTGVGRLVMGSVAESVARAVNVPVLLWRPALQPGEAQPAPGEALAQMLRQLQALQLAVATDSSTLGQEAVTLTADLTKQFDANLALLAIASEYNSLEHSQQLMQNASRLVESLEPRPNLIPLVGYADEVVLQYLDKNPTDLLAIGAFQDRGAGSKAIGTMAHRLVQYAPTSMLMYKDHSTRLAKILACASVDDALVIEVACHFAKAIGAQLDVLQGARGWPRPALPAAHPLRSRWIKSWCKVHRWQRWYKAG